MNDLVRSARQRGDSIRGQICAIINPVAGRGRSRRMWGEIRGLLHAAGIHPDETSAQYPGQAWESAAQATRDGAGLIVAVGGDGTLHETLNGLMQARAAQPPALAFVPGGTANIFARALNLPTTPERIARMLLEGVRRRIDIGQVNDRYYATIASTGFDAEVVSRAVRGPRWLGGRPRHAAGIVATLAAYRPRHVRMILDGREYTGPLCFLAAANTSWYGGGLHIAPGARPDDGQLAIVYATNLTRLETLDVLLKAFSGQHLRHPKVMHTAVKEARVDSDVPLGIQADGEWLGRSAAAFRVIPGAVDLIAPLNPGVPTS